LIETRLALPRSNLRFSNLFEEEPMKRNLRLAFVAVLSFTLGILSARMPISVRAAAAPLQLAVIDLTAIAPDAMPTPTSLFPELRSKTLVVTDGMSLAFQTGTVAKHYHADANEVQIVLSGTGSEWLGDKQVAIKPGTLIVIPKGTVHGNWIATSQPLELVSIKTPPQAPSDVHLAP
jgi:mannose-6-phosphate isomerase-like protein (cupin superfamily)